MASLGGNIWPLEFDLITTFAGFSAVALSGLLVSRLVSHRRSKRDEAPSSLSSFLLFFYSCFIKPHSGDSKGTQQDALESFYKKQAGAYDATRKVLLHGREDMLALVAAQLMARASRQGSRMAKPIWVDVGGGTGWNIEAMSAFVNVPEFFSAVYLVDLSPSLCQVARRRFHRLGWKNVKVVCEDARAFRLADHERIVSGTHGAVDLITMSYSLSMIPDYYSVIESLTSLCAPDGMIGVVDFYVQSKVDFAFRNYTGGLVGRHVHWTLRTFWRAWFDLDRVGLEAGRRDYLEYRFGTVLNVNRRNYSMGCIPYYIWVGCPKKSPVVLTQVMETIDALATEKTTSPGPSSLSVAKVRSKAFGAAAPNLAADLPLPSFFYQSHPWRLYYDDQLAKHTQFGDEYIYAFTWEDSRVDAHLLHLGADDIVLAITSAGDNILSYAMQGPARIHAVDLNPAQNHLLELKVAAYTALSHEDFWRLFGKGHHADFRSLLLTKLSPHLSSRAFQYWLDRVSVFASARGPGLYGTGGTRHALRVFRWLSRLVGCRTAVHRFLTSSTLTEQREIWHRSLRPTFLSRLLCRLVVSQESFLWAALGVPKNQLAMIEADYVHTHSASSSSTTTTTTTVPSSRPHAIWKYMVDTLDPVAEHTHIATDNPYYHVCMAGRFSRACHPAYLSAGAHARLSQPGALDGLRIHTDELAEVLARLAAESLTVAVVMDSMDWFDPGAAAAADVQVAQLHRVLKAGGRVLLRSAALRPWYIAVFEAGGFEARCVGKRTGGRCIDRVNMYASCWICTKGGGR